VDTNRDLTLRATVVVDAPPPPAALPAVVPAAAPTEAQPAPPVLPAHDALPAADNQVYAAAELVRRGQATRVTLVNAELDAALPDEWEINGTPIRLERGTGGRTVLIVGRRG
jgi:hypothetical protein